MRQRTVLLFALTAFVSASCSLLSVSDKSGLVGSWEWVQSTGGIAGHTITPDSTGYPERLLRFRADNSVLFYRADTLYQGGSYTLEQEDGETIISYEAWEGQWLPRQRVEFRGKDTLILVDQCDDCYRGIYQRVH